MDGDQASENSIQACEEIGLDLKDHRSAVLLRNTAENASAIFLHDRVTSCLLQMYFDLPEQTQIFLIAEFVEEGSMNYLTRLTKY